MNANAPQDVLDAIALPALRRGRGGMIVVRELNEADIPEIMAPAPQAQGQMTKLRNTHHRLAMVLAAGASNEHAALVTGYAPGTVVSLKRDPMFQELLAYYQSQKEVEFKDFAARAAALGLAFLDELQERLENSPGDFTIPQLLDGADRLLDRTILPSKGASVGGGPGGGVFKIEFVGSPNSDTKISIETSAGSEPLDITPRAQELEHAKG